ncbi:dehydrase and lipid transport-domain-containing protein [Thelephora terrestris]|uniref:Dehydrase and lipid transport-domain-containing protein n=1 Tax=Thelephora terrestris TaxID=56493 RepID=A0A9P6L3V4_9AGAM|nr:dehydrase and lipid transport-domain-containing protein [Thelephora terrestris]
MQTIVWSGSGRVALRPSWRSRTFFGIPDLSSLSPFSTPTSGGDKQTYNTQKVLPYSRQQLYGVVADVDSYNKFVPFCTRSKVLSQREPLQGLKIPDGFSMDAELTIGFLSFTESYVSKVTCSPYDSVKAVASSSTPLFKSLETTWKFEPVAHASGGNESTLVRYDIAFAFANPLHAAISAKFFGQVSGLMMHAFEDRCERVYGRAVSRDDVHR